MNLIKKCSFFASAILISSSSLFSQTSLDERLCKVFPTSEVPQQGSGSLQFNEVYSSSGSSWAINWPETHVFKGLLTYTHPTNPNYSYELRLGKGGQIYSFKTSSGETVAPQWRNQNAHTDPNYAPWVDEVWQMVAIDKYKNDSANDRKYFIHQAGVYLNDTTISNQQPFYSPQVASYYNSAEQEYTTINWGQQAHLDDNLSAGFTSSLLYYTKYKNIGNGIIQVDYMMYNFGTDTITNVNIPWGGVRRSTFDNFFISNSNNTFTHKVGLFDAAPFTTANTNGWVAFSSNNLGNAPSLGLIISKQNGGVLRVGDAAGDTSTRNYTAYSGVKTQLQLDFGKALRARNYFLLDDSVSNIRDRIASLGLASKTFFGYDTFTASEVPDTYFYFKKVGDVVTKVETTDTTALKLKLLPYENSYPLFLLKGKDSSGSIVYRVSSNLYSFSNKPYDGKLLEVQLIGFSDIKYEVLVEFHERCKGSMFTFADGSTQKLLSDVTRFNNIDTLNGYKRIKQTTVYVSELVPRSEIVGQGATGDLIVNTTSGNKLILKPLVTVNGITSIGSGTWTWYAPNSTTSNSGRVVTIQSLSTSNAGSYRFDYTDSNGCVSTCVFNVIVDGNSGSTIVANLDTGNAWYHDYNSNRFNAPISLSTGSLDLWSSTPTTTGNFVRNVSKYTRENATNSYIKFDLPGNLTDSAVAKFKIRVYAGNSSTSTNRNLKIILRKDNIGTTQIAKVLNVTQTNSWIEYTFDFTTTSFKEDYYNQILLFFASPDNDQDAAGNIYYFDAFQGPALTGQSIIMNTANKENKIELNKESELTIYPNPVSDILTINGDYLSAEIYTISGQLIKKLPINQKQVDVSLLSEGVYIIKIELPTGKLDSRRFIKK